MRIFWFLCLIKATNTQQDAQKYCILKMDMVLSGYKCNSIVRYIFILQAQSDLQSKLAFNEQATAVSNMLLKGFNNNAHNPNSINICKNLGPFPGSSNSGMNNPNSVNGNAFSNFSSLGLNTDHLQVTRPRMRICFDPETEIPRLQKWFSENNHPTRQQVRNPYCVHY